MKVEWERKGEGAKRRKGEGARGRTESHTTRLYLESVHKVKCLSYTIMFKSKACEVLNNNKFTFVNVCFQHERNAAIGH